MTWTRAMPVMTTALVFDAVRFLFEQFWFFGPVLIGVGTTAATSGLFGTWISSILGTAGGGVSGFVIGPALEVLGIILAVAVGFFGWLTVGLMIMLTNARIFKESSGNMLWFMFGLLISETPFIGSLPGLTGTTFKMYHSQIKRDREALARYESEQAESGRQEQAQIAAQITQIKAAEAANDESMDEIPDDVRKAA